MHVDPAAGRPRRPRRRSSTRCRRSRSASDRPASAASTAWRLRPWPSSSRLGTYGSTSRPKARSARTMIARPVSPSASKSPKTRTRSPAGARPLEPLDEPLGVGQEPRVVEALARRRDEGRAGSAASATPRRGEEPAIRSEKPAAAAAARNSGVASTGSREDASGSAARSPRQDAMTRCTPALIGSGAGHDRRPAGRPARGGAAGAAAAGRPSCATRRGASGSR